MTLLDLSGALAQTFALPSSRNYTFFANFVPGASRRTRLLFTNTILYKFQHYAQAYNATTT